jgi:hypothetical protein
MHRCAFILTGITAGRYALHSDCRNMTMTPTRIVTGASLENSGAVRLATGFALAALAWNAPADPISVPNGSFESPTGPFPPTGVSNQIDDWQKMPQPVWYDPVDFQGITWDQTSGIFPNQPEGEPGHIDNITDNQAAYMFSLPGAGFFQELGATYQPGSSYQLSLDLFGGGGLADGSQFSIGLYYVNAGNSLSVVTLPITYSAAAFPPADHFYTFDVTTPVVQGGDAWAGQNIGIALTSLSGPGQGYWDLDNVRLTVVPEPSTFTLLALGLGGGAWFWRRRKAAKS